MASALKKTRILIFEKERIVGLELKQALELKGFDACQPRSIMNARTLINRNHFDLIISDNTIINSKLIQLINKYTNQTNIPIIYLHTKDSTSFNQRKKYGIVASVAKPYNSKDLVDSIINKFQKII